MQTYPRYRLEFERLGCQTPRTGARDNVYACLLVQSESGNDVTTKHIGDVAKGTQVLVGLHHDFTLKDNDDAMLRFTLAVIHSRINETEAAIALVEYAARLALASSDTEHDSVRIGQAKLVEYVPRYAVDVSLLLWVYQEVHGKDAARDTSDKQPWIVQGMQPSFSSEDPFARKSNYSYRVQLSRLG